MSRPIWSAALAVIIFVCLTHRRNFINRILSQALFEPVARLTFAAYIVHPIIMQISYYSVVDRFRYSTIMVACWFASNLVGVHHSSVFR
jgi:peptidoglycan/LPS O-acetylase OafA/YrhL